MKRKNDEPRFSYSDLQLEFDFYIYGDKVTIEDKKNWIRKAYTLITINKMEMMKLEYIIDDLESDIVKIKDNNAPQYDKSIEEIREDIEKYLNYINNYHTETDILRNQIMYLEGTMPSLSDRIFNKLVEVFVAVFGRKK